jgi:hypothetical protein
VSERHVPPIEDHLAAALERDVHAPLLPWKYPRWARWKASLPTTILAHIRLTTRVGDDPRFVMPPPIYVGSVEVAPCKWSTLKH